MRRTVSTYQFWCRMAEQKTKPTAVSVKDYIAEIDDVVKRNDALTLVKLMQEATNEKPRMWGPSIIGFGKVHYKYASGHEGDTARIGFSPRKAAISLYLTCDAKGLAPYLEKLGKHKTGVGCIYIKRLSDVDMKALKELIIAGATGEPNWGKH